MFLGCGLAASALVAIAGSIWLAATRAREIEEARAPIDAYGRELLEAEKRLREASDRRRSFDTANEAAEAALATNREDIGGRRRWEV